MDEGRGAKNAPGKNNPIYGKVDKNTLLYYLTLRHREVIMENVDYTRLSSKGQFAVPKDIRESLKMKPGEEFLIFADNDTLILKRVQKPADPDIEKMFARSRKLAREKGLTGKDVENAVQSVRNEARH